MIFLTKLLARDSKTGNEKLWGGPRIEADSWEDAEQKISDRGYLSLDGWLIDEGEIRLSKMNKK